VISERSGDPIQRADGARDLPEAAVIWWILGGVCLAGLIVAWSVAVLIATGHWPWEA
jgi:hypothetical protein